MILHLHFVIDLSCYLCRILIGKLHITQDVNEHWRANAKGADHRAAIKAYWVSASKVISLFRQLISLSPPQQVMPIVLQD